MRPLRTLASSALAAFVWASGALAQPTAAGQADETVRLEPVTVWGYSAPGILDRVPGRLQWSVPASLATALEAEPSLALYHSGAATPDPVLRGLGSDRVVTAIDGLPLFSASPTRTASPLALISGGLPSGLEVVKSLPSVTLGPPANGGYLELSLAPPEGTAPPAGGYLGAAWNAGRSGAEVLARDAATRGAWSLRAAASAHSLGDYTAGNGVVVPAADRAQGAAASAAWRPDPTRELELGALVSRQALAINSALPLDTRDTTSAVFTGRGRWGDPAGSSVEARLGAGLSRPHLDNTGRPMPSRVSADGSAKSLSSGLAIHRHDGEDSELRAGLDATEETRSLQRKRPGAVDALWPDIRQQDAGAFAEITRPLIPGWKIRAGARADIARSEARTPDAAAYGGTVRSLYVAYNGPAAVSTARDDVAGSVNALLSGRLAPDLTSTFGAGVSRQPPGATERYRAFSDALGGGYEIGNPTARAEDKAELDWSLRWRPRTFTASVDAFASDLPNYLRRTLVGTTLPPGPPAAGAAVFGYRSTRAVIWGAEVEGCWQPRPELWYRLSGSALRGEDRDAGHRLTETPAPWASFTAGRAWPSWGLHPWIEGEVRATASQKNPAPAEMPIYADTAGQAIVQARAGIDVHGLRIAIAVENLFDRLAYDYLSPPAAAFPPSGSLVPGARIPNPGRTFILTLTWGAP